MRKQALEVEARGVRTEHAMNTSTIAVCSFHTWLSKSTLLVPHPSSSFHKINLTIRPHYDHKTQLPTKESSKSCSHSRQHIASRARQGEHVCSLHCAHSQLVIFNSTPHNELEWPLLRLPGEIRNEVFKLSVGSEHDGPSGALPEFPSEHALALTRTCRQLHVETHLLPSAHYNFQFGDGQVYKSFIARTTATQQILSRSYVLREFAAGTGLTITPSSGTQISTTAVPQ